MWEFIYLFFKEIYFIEDYAFIVNQFFLLPDFQVLDASSNVIQNQLLYSTLEHDYIFTSVEKWHYVEFPIASLLSGHDGKFYVSLFITTKVLNFVNKEGTVFLF